MLCVPRLGFWLQQQQGRLLKKKNKQESSGEMSEEGYAYSQREWLEGHVLRLQRTAYGEHDAAGPWEVDENGNTPITTESGVEFSGDRLWTTEVSPVSSSRKD